MDHVVAVEVRERLEQLQRDVDRAPGLEAALLEQLLDVLAGHELEHQVRPRRVHAEVAHGHAVRMVQAAHRHRFGLPGGRDFLVVDGKDGGDDRGLERGVRPVVHRPGAKIAAAEADPVQELLHQKVRRATHSRSSESTTR